MWTPYIHCVQKCTTLLKIAQFLSKITQFPAKDYATLSIPVINFCLFCPGTHIKTQPGKRTPWMKCTKLLTTLTTGLLNIMKTGWIKCPLATAIRITLLTAGVMIWRFCLHLLKWCPLNSSVLHGWFLIITAQVTNLSLMFLNFSLIGEGWCFLYQPGNCGCAL